MRELGAEAFRACLGEAVALSRFLLDELASRHNMDGGRRAGELSARGQAAAGRDPGMRAARQIEREMAGPAHAGRNGSGCWRSSRPNRWRRRLPSAAGRRRPDRISGVGYRLHGWGYDFAGHDFHDIPAEESDYTDYGHFHGAHGEPAGAPGGQQGGQRRQDGSPGRLERQGRLEGQGQWKGRREDDVGGFEGRRTMPSLAKRLLGLLLAHPELVDSMGDQQLEVIDHGPIRVLCGT